MLMSAHLVRGLSASASLRHQRTHSRHSQPQHLGIVRQQGHRCPKAVPLGRRGGAAKPVKAQAASDATGPASQQQRQQQRQRHAFLHDFCLCIPYGALITVCGLAMRLFGGGQAALLVAGAGTAQIVLSVLSLKTWRAQQPITTLFTMLEAGVASGLTYYAFNAFQRGPSAARIPHAALLLLSTAMALFLVYNIAAGGNPPPKERRPATATEDAA